MKNHRRGFLGKDEIVSAPEKTLPPNGIELNGGGSSVCVTTIQLSVDVLTSIPVGKALEIYKLKKGERVISFVPIGLGKFRMITEVQANNENRG